MWITDSIAKNSVRPSGAGAASIVASGSSGVDAVGSFTRSGAEVASPYGYSCVPVSGEEAVMIDVSGKDCCIGVKSTADGLDEGEIRICSAGGAQIELKNDGKVYINGKAVG